jgi:general secretion pathway protein G
MEISGSTSDTGTVLITISFWEYDRLISKRFGTTGFTLIELLIVIAIMGVLASIAQVNLVIYLERARIVRAISEIKTIEKTLFIFEISNGRWPVDLSEAGIGNMRDPWGNPYQYVPVMGTSIGKLRKDRFQVPINSDFDLYSMGRDGRSVAPLTAKASQDDIIRANNGGYVGLAKYY